MERAVPRASTSSPGSAQKRRSDRVPEFAAVRASVLAGDVPSSLFVLDKLRQGLCVFGGDQRLKLYNRRYAEMYDLAPEDLRIGMTLREIVDLRFLAGTGPEVSQAEFMAWRDRVVAQREITDTVVTLRDGRVHEIHHEPTADGGWVATFDDITDRARAEAALIESEGRLRALTDALPQMVWVVRAIDGIVTYANPRFYDYLGAIGPTRQDRIAAHHPDDQDRAAAAWRSTENDGSTFEIETRLRRADGVYRWHKLVVAPVRRDGVVVEWLGTALDIDDILTAQEALRDQSDLLQLSQEAAGAGLFDWNLVAGSARMSPESLRMFNLPEDRATDVGAGEWSSLIHPDDFEAVFREAERAQRTNTTYRVEFRTANPGGADRWILGVGRIVSDAAGVGTRMVGLNLDITERKQTEETLRVNQERLALALDSGSDGLWDWTIATGEVWYSDRWMTMLGYGPGELAQDISTWERLIHPEDRAMAISRTTAHFESRTAAYECEHRLRRKDGGWGWVLARGKVVSRTLEGHPIRIVGTHVDIDERKAAEGQIAHMARHDALTDLPNRMLFRERLDQRLAELVRYGGACAVLCLDLDRFKGVNDMLGHLAGDALLRETAHRLRTALRVEDTVARLGGDEFAVMLSNTSQPDEIAELAERLIALIGEPVLIGDQQVEVGLSIGIALAPDHGADTEDLLMRADLALYRAKAEGRNTACFFEPAMDKEAAERRRLENDLRHAIAHDELVLHYQPQVQGGTAKLLGFEALVRWQHPVQGLIPPSRFIPLAEETGLITSLGEWVLRRACQEATRWASPLKIAVNLSPRQFQQPDLPEVILGILAETGLSPTRLELEITESVIINDMARALSLLRRLKDLGIRIAMDDFGTGYSSLATLQAFPFDKIKIDRTFVGQVHDSAQAAVIVRAVLGLGRSLGMGVVAEGVETASQIEFLAEESCEELQGYFFGKPGPIENFRSELYPEVEAACAAAEKLPGLKAVPATHARPHRRRPLSQAG